MNIKLLPFAVLAVLLTLAYMVSSNPPQPKRGKPNKSPQLNIEVLTLIKQDVPLTITSYGVVKPRTQSYLLPQVAGEITYINEDFRDGGFFEQGEVLLQIDDRDYQAEIKIAKASLFNAKQGLLEEQARVKQAKQDWQRLGNGEHPTDLVLRKPQLSAAHANVLSAEAKLEKAELALKRTQIKAPFTGRILKKEVDVGQVVSQGTRLAEIYAVDYVEVRLPINNNDLPFIDLPESSRFADEASQLHPKVTIFSELVKSQHWNGKVVRTEGAFDQNSQTLFVVAQIDDPYGKAFVNGLPIKIGQYVRAKIQGKIVEQIIKLPNSAIYQGSYVYIVQQGILKRKTIDTLWQNEEFSLISSGVSQGDLLVVTPLGQVSSGTPVTIKKKDGKLIDIKRQKGKPQRNKQIQTDKGVGQ